MSAGRDSLSSVTSDEASDTHVPEATDVSVSMSTATCKNKETLVNLLTQTKLTFQILVYNALDLRCIQIA